jgi:hypothetical protein
MFAAAFDGLQKASAFKPKLSAKINDGRPGLMGIVFEKSGVLPISPTIILITH